MEICEPPSKKLCQRNGTAYIVIREEKRVNELGDNVPSLVPYDCSSESEEEGGEKEQTSDDLEKYGGPCVSKSEAEAPKSESNKGFSSEDGTQSPLFFGKYKMLPSYSLLYQITPERYEPRSPEKYAILTVDTNCDESEYISILKDNGCSESCFHSRCTVFSEVFYSTLHKEQVKKLQGDKRVLCISPAEEVCEC